MSRKMNYCDLEDLAVAQIVSQLDESVEVHCSRLLALYTTGECGMEWILAIIDEMNKVTQRLGLRGNKKNDNNNQHQHQTNQTEQGSAECWRCGKQHDANGCWAKEAICHSCDLKGHISTRRQTIQEFRAKRDANKGKGAGKGQGKGQGKGKGGDRRANQADKAETHQACEQCGKYHQYGQTCKTQNSIKSKIEKDMAEAMNMTIDKFREKPVSYTHLTLPTTAIV